MATSTLFGEKLAQACMTSGNPLKQGERKDQRCGSVALSFLFLFIVNLAGAAYAQEVTTLQGNVADEKGALVVGAKLSLNDRRGHRYDTQTNKEGRYDFVAVPPGSYTLSVSATGFAEFTRTVELALSHTATLDIILKITLREQLEVRAARDSLTAITIAGPKVAALPQDPRLLHRRLRQLARATGASGDPAIYVDGLREEGRLPPKEDIESIRISSDPFAAEFSEPGEARVEITTRPATDTFHGAVNFTFNNEALNARDQFALRRAPVRLRDYSTVFSGPIKGKRWGFFLGLSRKEADENAVVNATILSTGTLLPQPFITTVVTPLRDTDFSFRTNSMLGRKHQLDLKYSHSNSSAQNQGLEDGFDLPERAATTNSRDDALRLTLISVFSERWLNEARLELSRNRATDVALNSGPTVLVLESFNGGGNQDALFNGSLSQDLQLADDLTYARGRHTWRAGVFTDAVRFGNTDRSNFGGTFIFGTDFERNNRSLPVPGPVLITPLESYRRTLLGLTGYRPLQFTINHGDPFVGLTQWGASLFAQDDWRFNPRLTVSYGLRAEFQTHLQDKLYFAPRAAMAARPFKHSESTLRVGAGLFYARVDPEITVDAERFNGLREEELVVQRPAFFLTIPPVLNRATSLTSIRTKSPDLTAPYSFLVTASYQQKLPGQLSAILSYSWERGVHLLRTRNANAPLPDSPNLRPQPAQGPILEYESAGRSQRHEFVVALQGDLSNKLSFYSSYRLAFAHSDTDSPNTAPANSYDLSTEFGRAETDQRHQFYFEAYVGLPWGLQLSPNIYIASGGPFNITTGNDDNADTLFTDRPAFANASDPRAIITRFGVFNPHPQSGDMIIPRNFGRGPGEVSVDLNLSKTFTFGASSNGTVEEGKGESSVRAPGQSSGHGSFRFARGLRDRHYSLTFSMDAYNLLNHTNFGEFNGVITSPLFGRANRADKPRRINLGVRFVF